MLCAVVTAVEYPFITRREHAIGLGRVESERYNRRRSQSFPAGLPGQATILRAKDSGWADQFRGAFIQGIFQKNGNTFVEVRNSSGFPSQILRDYVVRVGPHMQRLPTLNPGQVVTLEFEHVNPYRVDVCGPTGFVVDSR